MAKPFLLPAGLVFAVFGLAACGENAGPPSEPAGGAAGSTAAGGRGGGAGSGMAGSSGGAGTSGGRGGAGAGGTTSLGGTTSGGSGAGVSGASAGTTSGSAGSTAGSGAAGRAGGAGSGGDGGSAGAAGGRGGSGGAAGNPAGGSGGGGSGGVGGSGGGGGSAGASYQPCPEDGPCVIMPFGDSITEGFAVVGGYRSRLFSLARGDDHEITFVGSASNNGPSMVDGVPFPQDHEGHGGFTISGSNGISRYIPSSLNDYEPDIVLLMIGTNDLNGNIDVANAPDRLGDLLDSIFEADPDILVILAQIVPTRTDGTNQTVQTYNAAMPALVEERVDQGRHLVLIDMYGAFTRDQNYKNTLLADNLHPNEAGYQRMAETWYAALTPYLR